MADLSERPRRQQLFDLLSTKDSDYLYCVVRDWNWSNGTWLLRWIASQAACTRGTAQRIFWDCQPETFLPVAGAQVPFGSPEFDLAALVLENWKAGAYPADRQSLSDRLRSLVSGGQGGFRGDDGTWYRAGQIGYFDPANPVPQMEAYRAAEARCDPSQLPWTLPDDLGRVQRVRRPSYTGFDLVEGVPEEFVDLLDEDEPA
ncbi:MAG TPA: DUF4274 domain-containing protein [Ornithinibacter sp.]|nr:DUF4274 domain-containing protein [Ornithinibacter sp.]